MDITAASAPDGTAPDVPGRPIIELGLVVLDTPDLAASANFYARLLGVEVVKTQDDWITLGRAPSGLQLAFQWAGDFTAPSWPGPEVPQQVHLDLHVEDLDAAERFALTLGARPVEGPGDDSDFRVYLDPVGHPFCFCQAS